MHTDVLVSQWARVSAMMPSTKLLSLVLFVALAAGPTEQAFVIQPNSNTVRTGDTAYFLVQVDPALNQVAGQWYKDGQSMVEDPPHLLFQDKIGPFRTLVIVNAGAADTGSYEYRINAETSQGATLSIIGGATPVHGGWAEWTQWTDPSCGITCGSGQSVTSERTRTCTAPRPSNGGNNCLGDAKETRLKTCNFPACGVPLDGGWVPWTQWTDPSCGITCGSGQSVTSERTRTCTSPSPLNGGRDCVGVAKETRPKTCNFAACGAGPRIVTGLVSTTAKQGDTVLLQVVLSEQTAQAGIWYENGVAIINSASRATYVNGLYRFLVINGIQTSATYRYRIGTETTQATVTVGTEQVDGQWAGWTQWNEPSCGITCGSGPSVTSERTRKCAAPAPLNGGRDCVGDSRQTRLKTCNLRSCDVRVDGNWAGWTQWTDPSCGITCGSGQSVTRARSRSCTNPAPLNGGSFCVGESRQSFLKTCNFPACLARVDGNWAGWTTWTDPPCGNTCGSGQSLTRERSRTCSNPAPLNGGSFCVGDSRQTLLKTCNFAPCVGVGGFSQWSSWSGPTCTVTCGGQIRNIRRTRSCVAPLQGCNGEVNDFSQDDCAPNPCIQQVDGQWAGWTQWTDPSCGMTCGSGPSVTSQRTRKCAAPAPLNGGRDCVGDSRQTRFKTCNFAPCLVRVNGNWAGWTQWTDPSCGITCGSGQSVTRARSRTCSNPAPLNGGSFCVGDSRQTLLKTCNFAPCVVPIHGNWAGWTQWTDPSCGITCGSAPSLTRERSRTCTAPVPMNGGRACVGDRRQTLLKTCIFAPCGDPVDHLCRGVLLTNRIGYRPHPTDCEKYIQCYYKADGSVHAVYRTCSFRNYWDQAALLCNDARDVNCATEKCTGNCEPSYKLAGSCRSYWECSKGKSIPSCCKPGYKYEEGYGCRPSYYCKDNCPGDCGDEDVCQKLPRYDANLGDYTEYMDSIGWINSSCIIGSYFDVNDCSCSAVNYACRPTYSLSFDNTFDINTALRTYLTYSNVDVGNGIVSFNRNSTVFANVSMATRQTTHPVIIRFRYRESPEVTGKQVLVSSRSCQMKKGNTLVMVVDNNQLDVEITSWHSFVERLSISTTGIPRTSWKTVTLIYSGYDMIVSIESGKLRYTARAYNVVDSTIIECGFHFGTEGNMKTTETNLIGELDEFSLYKCDPGRL